MGYKIEVKVDENWITVVDMKLTKADQKVDRIFMTEESAKYFAEQNIKNSEYKIVSV